MLKRERSERFYFLVAESAHARTALYTSLIRNFGVGLFGWMDGLYAN